MAWATVQVHEQRVRFVVRASRGRESFSDLCREFEISRPTGYEWLKRYRSEGVSGIVEGSRRPKYSPRRTAAKIEERVVELRQACPDWGARKLRLLLGKEGPQLSLTTVQRILERHDLIRERDRQSQAIKRFERSAPNEMWQMDFKSPIGWQAPVGPLSVLDDHTRYAIDLHGTWTTQAKPVRERLEIAFTNCGVPEEMLMDHGTPWWNPNGEAGWSWLTVWLMKQGIRLHFSGKCHPQTQGKVERFHGSLQAALRRRGLPALEQRQSWLDRFRHEYNHVRPHEALQMRTPAELWRPSSRSYQPSPPSWEYPAGSILKRVSPNGQISYGGRGWVISRALQGQWVQLERIDHRILVFYCNTPVREIDLERQQVTAVTCCHS